MNKEDNLIKTSMMTPEQRVEFARKGAYASHEARKEKKLFRERLRLLERELIKNKTTGEERERADVIALQLMQKAAQGDLKAIRLYLEATDQLKQQVELQQAVPVVVKDDGLD